MAAVCVSFSGLHLTRQVREKSQNVMRLCSFNYVGRGICQYLLCEIEEYSK